MTNAAPQDIEIDAEVLAEGFGIDPTLVQEELRAGAITSRAYRGIGADEGTWQLVFFYRNARLTVITDRSGRPLRRSLIDFGARPLPTALRRR